MRNHLLMRVQVIQDDICVTRATCRKDDDLCELRQLSQKLSTEGSDVHSSLYKIYRTAKSVPSSKGKFSVIVCFFAGF